MLVRTEHSQAHTHRHGTPGAGIKDASKTITRPAYRCHRAAVFCLHAAECAKTTLPPVHDAEGDSFFLGRQRMVILASQSHLQLRQLGASGVGCQMPWGTVEDLFRERQQQQGPDPAVPRVGSELTFVSPRGSLPPC